MRWETVEERLARRILERFNLTPPVDVHRLAEAYAHLSITSFPVDVDGVTVGLKQPGRRPRIYINSQISPTRRRFTLAHELGHVLIPTHTGSIVDEFEVESGREEPHYWDMEAEANRFAAELLMPSDWCRSLIGNPDEMSVRVRALANQAEVSIDSAALKALRVGPPGFVMAKSDGINIEWAGRTEGTLANPPLTGVSAAESALTPASSFGSNRCSEGAYLWWKVEEKSAVPPPPQEDWRTILSRIISSTRSANPLKTSQSINGIISAANGSVRDNRSIERVYSACLQRLQNRHDRDPAVTSALAHPEFMDYVIAKVHTLRI